MLWSQRASCTDMLEYATDEYPRIADLKEAHRQIHEVGQDINDARRRADAHWALFNIQHNVTQCPVWHFPRWLRILQILPH